MRLIALLAPLLLSGCALLVPGVPPAPEGIEHDGYILACEGVAIEACREAADRVASDIGDDRRVRWMVIRPDGHEACWTGPLLTTCERLTDTPVRRFHEPG